jgi:hypothetical protein
VDGHPVLDGTIVVSDAHSIYSSQRYTKGVVTQSLAGEQTDHIAAETEIPVGIISGSTPSERSSVFERVQQRIDGTARPAWYKKQMFLPASTMTAFLF